MTDEVEHRKLQDEFIDLIERMLNAKCPLPSFCLHYMARLERNRDGTKITVRPFLTEEEADRDCGDDVVATGRHWNEINHKVIESEKDGNGVEIEITDF